MAKFKFKGKYIITADLRCLTGLHVGGTQEGFEIGGLDNPVIKDPFTEYPYIPGSSLKGKMRNLLEWIVPCNSNGDSCIVKAIKEKVKGKYKNKKDEDLKKRLCELTKKPESEFNGKSKDELLDEIAKHEVVKDEIKPCSCGKCDVCIVFGSSAETEEISGPTRLTIRDSFPTGLFKDDGNRISTSEKPQEGTTIANWQILGENTELKMENTIDRLTSSADPRQMERVPADSVFKVEMVYDVYENEDIQRMRIIFQGMQLLEESFLGGSGSRGSGKVKFENINIIPHSLDHYGLPIEDEQRLIQPRNLNNYKTAKDIRENFKEIWGK
jgi:CRISPR-associated protein Csm3